MSTKKPSTGGAGRRPAQAIELFEKAVKALGKRDFEKARDHLDLLLRSFPEERDLAERARCYRLVCDRALTKRPSFRPKTAEDLLGHGVYLHNRGEHGQALKVFHQAAELAPKNEHILYCIAASAARSGDLAGALEALRSAVGLSPGTRTQARLDADFESLHEHEDFLTLVYGS
ncbi:MAG: tetratricopeptide repeat protein [Candidatus Latescibacterota bacterium]